MGKVDKWALAEKAVHSRFRAELEASLPAIIELARIGQTEAAEYLLKAASYFFRRSQPLPGELGSYLADAFDSVVGAIRPAEVPSPLRFRHFPALLEGERLKGKDSQEALNLRRRRGHPSVSEDTRRMQRFFLAFELALELTEQEKQWSAFIRQKLDELELNDRTPRARGYIRRWKADWKKNRYGGDTVRKWAQKRVAHRHSVSVREVERAWKAYGAGPGSTKVSNSPIGKPEMTAFSFLHFLRRAGD